MPKYPRTTEYDETGFAPPLENGEYKIRLSEVTETDKNGSYYKDKEGYRYLLFVFDVSGYSGNKLFDRICFDLAHPYMNLQLGRFKQMQVAMGVDTDKEGDTDNLIGNVCIAQVIQKTVKEKVLNNITRYSPIEEQTEIAKPVKGDDDDDLPF